MPLPPLYNAYNLPNIVDEHLPPAVAKVVAAEVKCVDHKPKQLRLLPQKWVSPETKGGNRLDPIAAYYNKPPDRSGGLHF
jgi:hypothetical protein